MSNRCWPLPKDKIRITSRFAGRINPVTGRKETHSGTDFGAPDGTPFYAVADGTVQYIGAASGYGQWIVIDHPASVGGGCSEYGHMWNAFATNLKVGSKVRKGQLIGYVGSNGQSTGPHLHLTIWEYGYGGRRVDPETWLTGADYPGATKAPATKPASALDYYNVIPHKIALLGGHFTYGRDAIRGLVRHHTAGVLDAAAINQIWKPGVGRQASTNYLTDHHGIVSQHVWDKDTPWANANTWANRNLLSMEHSNSAGAPGWPINDETIIGGARWGAALLRFYDCGRPKFEANVFDHRKWAQTSCPHHLNATNGKYNDEWFEESTWFYDQLQAKLVDPQGNPIKTNFPPPAPKPANQEEEFFLSKLTEAEQREALTKIREIHNALFAPVPSKVEGSKFKAPLAEFVLLTDRKVEELHKEYAGKHTAAQQECEAHAVTDANHNLEDEEHHDAN